ncbi:MAG: SDR family oxidoreductase [Bacteroidetes bacterium]|nr:SDR family oxidoreductase [Bacteroidota bacterium]
METKKTAIITGASRGIGAALALQLAESGMNLCLVARDKSDLEQVAASCKTFGARCEIFAGSVDDEALAKQVADYSASSFGGIDFMINNAGYGVFKRASEISVEEWDRLYDVNVKGTFIFSKAVLSCMKKQGSGHIINVASDVAKRVFDGGSLYCSSKYAQDAFSMALRKEVREFGIKVSVIYSGLVDSMFHQEPQGDAAHRDWLQVSDMARSIAFVMNQPRHVVIDELMIHPLSQEY